MNIAADARPMGTTPFAKQPDVLSRERLEAACWRFELAVPANLAWFDGHFPDHPVLPGVAQIGWAIRFAREAFGFKTDPPSIERIKFQRPIAPGDRITLELTLTRNARHNRVDWRFLAGDNLLSRGRFEFAPTP